VFDFFRVLLFLFFAPVFCDYGWISDQS